MGLIRVRDRERFSY